VQTDREDVLKECDLKTISHGRERISGGHDVPRHRHREAYAIVVVRGAFAQTGYAGRLRARTGDLVIQPTLDTHANTTPYPGVTILRLPWPDVDRGGAIELVDPDAIVRAAERDVQEASAIARDQVCTRAPRPCRHDLPDLLASDLADGRVTSLSAWAASAGVARETCARAFTTAFGVPARTFRCELRARAAWLSIIRTREPLAEIASATGFADQAHMTRHVRALTGRPPAAWR
jgi:AraC-like DNA-binding protein